MESKLARRALVALLGTGVLVALAWLARSSLDIGFDPDSVRHAVAGLGIWAPIAFVGLVTFRVPLGVPSQLALIAGGLVFGTAAGTLYGAAGITLSGLLLFLAARWAGRDAVRRRVPARLVPAVDVAGSRIGAAFLTLGTGYPFGPITAYHGLAGLTPMSLLVFVWAIAAGALVRSATYTYLGSSLGGGDWTRVAQAAGVLALVAIVPLLHPRTRRWVRELVRRDVAAAPDQSGPAG